jgi:predicted nucleic acid-binding protein
LWPWDVVAERAWALRHNLTSYDAAYVALAEILEAPLVTLDRRLERAPATHCVVVVPPNM